jgi:hypothetical protein
VEGVASNGHSYSDSQLSPLLAAPTLRSTMINGSMRFSRFDRTLPMTAQTVFGAHGQTKEVKARKNVVRLC